MVCVRPELCWKGSIVEDALPHQMRVSPSLPPERGSVKDVMFFAGREITAEDFHLLARLCDFLGRRAYFVDCDWSCFSSTWSREERWCWREEASTPRSETTA